MGWGGGQREVGKRNNRVMKRLLGVMDICISELIAWVLMNVNGSSCTL